MLNDKNTPLSKKYVKKQKFLTKIALGNNNFITFATKSINMTLQKWIKDRAIHGYPTYIFIIRQKNGVFCNSK